MMITDILQIADHLVFSQTGKHLDNLQEAVIKGVWQNETYREIAEECNHSEGRVRDVGYKLWEILSKQLGEDINKSNFRSSFKRLNITSSQNQRICHVSGSNHSFNYSPSILYDSKQDNPKMLTNNNLKLTNFDFNLAPTIIKFYNRESELKALSSWILDNNIRLISVLELSGIGKTTLVKRWVDLNLDKFEVIIWKSLKYPKPLELLIDDLLNTSKQELKATRDDNLKQLFDFFRDKKCLIILDDVHHIFTKGEFSGQYQSVYQDYQNFFKLITETEHQSHLI
ncbi:MAG: NB-ARC domain-containing protein, partial [Planktothrix sp.]|uniref:NB-ARC domain-containing protein n=1 Tax=Planktothrix sp. TaxID=3088171 RepID=UPI0038D3C0D5